ncbi:MAG: GntR family transcriptional regulator [Acidobacteria bacterium]|nr:GntR family transcriptional regulator [Acidobacteriota bacterium]
MSEPVQLPRLPRKRLDTIEAYRTIRRCIVDGVLKPGERLVEERLAHHLGVSRTPVREALAMLEVEGLVKSIPKKGTVVRTFTREEIKDLYDLRIVLEAYAARQASQFITSQELDQMGKLYEEMEECIQSLWRSNNDQVEKVRYLTSKNSQFHQVVMKASRNARLEAILTQIVELPLIFRAFFWYTKDQLSQSNHHHYELIKALEMQDTERAERIMAVHIGIARDLLLHEVDAQPE